MKKHLPPILVIEDDDDIRSTVVDMLAFEGYRAIGASHGIEALELLQATEPKPALILLDLMMPLMNGVEFRRHQLTDPALAHIPVVLLTADANPDSRCTELGARGCLKKPLRIGALLETAQRFTGRS